MWSRLEDTDMEEQDETLDDLVTRGFNTLERREQYDLTAYRTPGEAAEVLFRRALDIDQHCYDALLGLGQCYSYRPQKYVEALALFSRAAGIRPNQPEPSYLSGLTLLHAGEIDMEMGQFGCYGSALISFERALELGFDPKAEVYNALGTVSYRMGEYSDAVKWFQLSYDSLRRDGGWQPSTFFLAADACEHLGKFAEAISWYELYKEYGHLNDQTEIDDKIEDLREMMSRM
jgi:tetratricopeptide (TPR) repeat protein